MHQINARKDAGGSAILTYADANFRAARVKRTTNQSIVTATVTPINLNQEDFDEWGLHDNATNNTRITVDVAGGYHISAWITWAGTLGSFRVLGFQKNGALTGQVSIEPSLPVASTHSQSCSETFIECVPGDYFEVYCRHAVGSNINITSAVFCLYRLHEE